MDLNLLYGTWCEHEAGAWNTPENTDQTNCLIFQRQDSSQIIWGKRFVFKPDGTFEDYYAVRCGNDPRFHHWIGTWHFVPEWRSLILTTDWPSQNHGRSEHLYEQKPYSSGSQYQIEELSHDRLVLLHLSNNESNIDDSIIDSNDFRSIR